MKKIAILLCLLFCLGHGSVSALAPVPEIKGQAAIVKSMDTGLVLYGKNEIVKLPPSHLTKMMTALLAVQHYKDLGTTIVASESAVAAAKGLTGTKIVPGEELTVKDLLYMLLLANGADAANVLAEDMGGDVAGFVAEMNAKCEEMGLRGTHFTNPHGAHEEAQYTTASDMADLCQAVMKNATLAEIVDTQYKRIAKTNKTNGERYYFSNNAMVISSTERRRTVEDYYYRYAKGTMTGVSKETGYSIAATLEQDDMGLIVVVLGSIRDENTKVKFHYRDVMALGEYMYENYQYALLLKDKEPIGEVEVSLSGTNDFVTLISTKEEWAIVPSDMGEVGLERVVRVADKLEAPIKKGEVVGEVDFVYQGKIYATLPVASQTDIQRNQLLFFLDRVGSFMSGVWFRYTAAAVVSAVALYLLLMLQHNRKEKKRHQKKRRPRPPKRYR